MSTRPAAATDNDTPTYFIDEGSHKFRTELPNLIDDLGLSVYAHRLYTHIKRRAGEGEKGACTAGLRGMAKSCGMSLGMAAKARQELLDLGLIRFHVEIVRHKNGGGRYEVLTAANVWPANFTFYARRELLKPFASDEARAAAARAHLICFLLERGHRVVRRRPAAKGASPEFWGLEEARGYLATFLSDGGVSPHEHPPRGVSPRERGCSPGDTPGVSPGEHKKEPSGRRTREEHTHTARVRATTPSATAGVCVTKSRFSLEERKAHAGRHNLGGGWLTNSRDGRYDEAIELDIERLAPEAAETRRRAPADNTMTLSAARVHVRSVLSVGVGTDGAALIDSLLSYGKISAQTGGTLLDELPQLLRQAGRAMPGARQQLGHVRVVPAPAAP
jgi:hypothetical protein